MRIQLITACFLFAVNIFAADDKSMKELFQKYDSVMDHQKIDLIDEVFTKKFITASGGKPELIEKIKGLATPDKKAMPRSKMTWKKGQKGELYLAKLTTPPANKSKDKKGHEAEFLVIKEDGKLKIDGTLSDGN
jgi:hypothetical protein